MDCKRPYGNSDVINDIAEILGIEPEAGGDSEYSPEYSGDQHDYMNQLHEDMQTVLQILVRNAATGIKPGVYVSEDYANQWQREGKVAG